MIDTADDELGRSRARSLNLTRAFPCCLAVAMGLGFACADAPGSHLAVPDAPDVAGTPAPTPTEPMAPGAEPAQALSDLPVIQRIEVTYDGEEFTYRTLDPSEKVSAVGTTSSGLVTIDSQACATCTSTTAVAFTNVGSDRRLIVNGSSVGADPLWTGSDATNCGPVPASGTGICQRVRLRNLFGVQLERVYVELEQLSVRGSTTRVGVHASQPFLATPDFGASLVNGALWRFGQVGRASPEAGGATMWWAFEGDTPGTAFRFGFIVQVRGLFTAPTRRINLADGDLDVPGAGGYAPRTVVAPTAGTIASLARDGNYAAFISGVTPNRAVYRKNLATGALELVASGCGAGTTDVHLSRTGQVLVFTASVCNPAGYDPVTTGTQVYAHDFSSGVTVLVSRSTTDTMPAGSSTAPRLAAAGLVVVFRSTANNLVSGFPTPGADGNGRSSTCLEAYRHDLATGVTVHVSGVSETELGSSESWANNCTGLSPAGTWPDVSGDGTLVAFSSALPLESSDSGTTRDVYIYDHALSLDLGIVASYRVSLTSDGSDLGTPLSATAMPALSASGLFVAFSSSATNINPSNSPGVGNGSVQVYRRSTALGDNGSILLVSRSLSGLPGTDNSSATPEISTSGRFVAFWSNAGDIAAAGAFNSPTNPQVYVCDMNAPVASLRRCWVVSTFQATPAAGFSILGDSQLSGRIGLSYPINFDAGYVLYGVTASTWPGVGGETAWFVSPVGDPRYQQAAVNP